MKIKVNQISLEGLTLEENIPFAELELEEEFIKFRQPVMVKADIFKIANAVTIDLFLSASIYMVCSRCLDEVKIDLNKKQKLNYQITGLNQVIDLNPEIREEIILDYPIKPLCKSDCKGLCPKCGEKLKEGGCSCGIT